MLQLRQLKVKIKSLAAEARIIRLEEARSKNPFERMRLSSHRTDDVRREARAAQLAYGFLRGREYNQIESPNSSNVDWGRVQKLVEKFGESYCPETPYKELEQKKLEQAATFRKWIDFAKLYRGAKDGKRKQDSGQGEEGRV